MTARVTLSSSSARQERCLWLALAFAVLLTPFPIQRAKAQQTVPAVTTDGQRTRVAPDPMSQIDNTSPDTTDAVMQERRWKALNAERQKSMVADTNRLVKLAAELNAEVNGPHPRALSADQLRKVAEIEKLARSIRGKMCTSVKEISQPVAPLPPIPTGLR